MPASAVRLPFVLKRRRWRSPHGILQASGNEFSVPWDVIQTTAIGKKRGIYSSPNSYFWEKQF